MLLPREFCSEEGELPQKSSGSMSSERRTLSPKKRGKWGRADSFISVEKGLLRPEPERSTRSAGKEEIA